MQGRGLLRLSPDVMEVSVSCLKVELLKKSWLDLIEILIHQIFFGPAPAKNTYFVHIAVLPHNNRWFERGDSKGSGFRCLETSGVSMFAIAIESLGTLQIHDELSECKKQSRGGIRYTHWAGGSEVYSRQDQARISPWPNRSIDCRIGCKKENAQWRWMWFVWRVRPWLCRYRSTPEYIYGPRKGAFELTKPSYSTLTVDNALP